ncbi:hypothetical protein Halha_1675 [Halobacteroides halobius DSM 5150]|uniref:Uncharacterized protein n=1 Tax=Halobacteroides halobius (strain ATCC 35273 / DSM 5150 / MD-1) TaxID=748449 RepID=L0K8J7_HALHC|nr:hypothetical protein [Halobacteroides halobius]AGB41612.1 hypothetical protein Halha_1675 [Halobacteroides halobius DSM 5150]
MKNKITKQSPTQVIEDLTHTDENNYKAGAEVAEDVVPGFSNGVDYTPQNDEQAEDVIPGVDMGDYNMPLDDVVTEDDTKEAKAKEEINIAEKMDVDIDVAGYDSVDQDITDEMDDDINTDYNSKQKNE